MALRSNELAVRDGGQTEPRVATRSDPLRVRIELTDLASADRHELICTFECSARIGDHPADRKLFVELLMADRSVVTREDIANHLRPALFEAAAAAAINQPVATLLSEAGRASLQDVIRKAADSAAFNAGLVVLAPFQFDLTSPSLARQQREAAQRSRVEEVAAGRLDHLRHATELLKQFESIRTAAPSISAGQVLERIAPADRGALLEAMLAGDADRATGQTLYAVAGTALLKIDPLAETPTTETIELPTLLGPLRSVQSADIDGEPRLLVGARGGILLVDPKNPMAAAAYHVPELNSSLGFNRAAFLPGLNALFATHGEAGLVRWDRGEPAKPVGRMRASELTPHAVGPVRNIQLLDRSTAVCSVGSLAIIVTGSQSRTLPSRSAAPIINIVPAGDRLYIIHDDGSVAVLDLQSQQIIRNDSRGGSVAAAGGLPWQDGLRLLLACSDGPIDCVGPDDSLVTRYNSVYRGFRNITATTRCVAAVSPDRQRLILWNSWDGRAPAYDLHLASLTRHRIADITFA